MVTDKMLRRAFWTKCLTDMTGLIGVRLSAQQEQYLLDDLEEMFDNEGDLLEGSPWYVFRAWDAQMNGPDAYIGRANNMIRHARKDGR